MGWSPTGVGSQADDHGAVSGPDDQSAASAGGLRASGIWSTAPHTHGVRDRRGGSSGERQLQSRATQPRDAVAYQERSGLSPWRPRCGAGRRTARGEGGSSSRGSGGSVLGSSPLATAHAGWLAQWGHPATRPLVRPLPLHTPTFATRADLRAATRGGGASQRQGEARQRLERRDWVAAGPSALRPVGGRGWHEQRRRDGPPERGTTPPSPRHQVSPSLALTGRQTWWPSLQMRLAVTAVEGGGDRGVPAVVAPVLILTSSASRVPSDTELTPL